MTKNIQKYDPKQPRKKYSEAELRRVKAMYESEGMAQVEIQELTGIHVNIISRWVNKYNWVQGKNVEIIEKTELQARMELAKEIGLSERDQLEKAKALMEAGAIQEVTYTDKEGKICTLSKNVPDYRIQNEGLKRAMELTGTKIERKEIEHKGKHEVVHKYELPQKKPLE